MKKNNIYSILFLLLSLAFATSCGNDSNDDEPTMLSTEKSIIEFSIGDRQGIIDEENKTIDISLPYGTDLAELTPTIKISEKATVSPKSGTSLDFTSTVVFTVTAENKSTETYSVSATADKNSEAKIISFSFDNLEPKIAGVIDEEAKTITVNVPYETNLNKMTPTVIIKGKNVSPTSLSEQDFSKPVPYMVTADNGTEIVYTVAVNRTTTADANILTFELKGIEAAITIDHNTSEILALVPFGTDTRKLAPVITFEGKEIEPASGVQQDFASYVLYTVTATDNTQKIYKVRVDTKPFETKITHVANSRSNYSYYPGDLIYIDGNFADSGNEAELRDANKLLSVIKLTYESKNSLSGNISTLIAHGEYTLYVKSNGTTAAFEASKITIMNPTLPVINPLSERDMIIGYDALSIGGRNVAGYYKQGPVEAIFRMDGESAPYKRMDVTPYIHTYKNTISLFNIPTADLRPGKQYVSIEVEGNVSNEEDITFKVAPAPYITGFRSKEFEIGKEFRVDGNYFGLNIPSSSIKIEVYAYNEVSKNFEIVEENALRYGGSWGQQSFSAMMFEYSWARVGMRIKTRISINGHWSNMTEDEALIVAKK